VRLRILKTPPASELEGVHIGRYRQGLIYEVPNRVANVFLAEGWAVPVPDETPALILPPKEASAILIVEDDDDMRTITVELLAAIGNPIVTARNGEEALRMLREKRPALVLLDLMMPVMDGWQFRAAQQQLADRELAAVPVVLLTAVPNPEKLRSDLKAVAVISKPVENFEVIVETVRRWLKT
jgi:CheY-like chemotaxis protein